MGIKMRLTEELDIKVVIEVEMLDFTSLLHNVNGRAMLPIDMVYYAHLLNASADKAKARLDYLAEHVEYAPGFQPTGENVKVENQLILHA